MMMIVRIKNNKNIGINHSEFFQAFFVVRGRTGELVWIFHVSIFGSKNIMIIIYMTMIIIWKYNICTLKFIMMIMIQKQYVGGVTNQWTKNIRRIKQPISKNKMN